jgi:hypothetical protein
MFTMDPAISLLPPPACVVDTDVTDTLETQRDLELAEADRILLLKGGDVERHPGPLCCYSAWPCGYAEPQPKTQSTERGVGDPSYHAGMLRPTQRDLRVTIPWTLPSLPRRPKTVIPVPGGNRELSRALSLSARRLAKGPPGQSRKPSGHTWQTTMSVRAKSHQQHG